MPDDQQKPVITMVRHHHNATELQDNAAAYLTSRGFDVSHRYPFDGDHLRIPDTGVTPTIILGGGQNVADVNKQDYLRDELHWIETCLAHNTPLLGICLGAQMIAHVLGAEVSARDPVECEYGFYTVYPTEEAGRWLADPMDFMQAHYQEFALPDTAVRLAYSDRFPQQAFRYGDNTYAIQFHPEVNRPIFEHWLADTWSEEMATTKGAQEKKRQAQQAEKSLAMQQRWLELALDNLFLS